MYWKIKNYLFFNVIINNCTRGRLKKTYLPHVSLEHQKRCAKWFLFLPFTASHKVRLGYTHWDPCQKPDCSATLRSLMPVDLFTVKHCLVMLDYVCVSHIFIKCKSCHMQNNCEMCSNERFMWYPLTSVAFFLFLF